METILAFTDQLYSAEVYHVYNRSNNHECLFKENRNYHYFLDLYTQYINPIADTFAYCLLPNHFHLLIRIRPEPVVANVLGLSDPLSISRQFGNFFNAYTKAINSAYARTGSLFQRPFKRKVVQQSIYFSQLVLYIHVNPQKHGFIDNFTNWNYSSYRSYLSSAKTRLCQDEVMSWFQSQEQFKQAHVDWLKDHELSSGLILDQD